MPGESQQIKKGAEKIGEEAKKQVMDNFRALMQHALKKGSTPKDALGLTDAMVEGIYGQAYRLYNTGKFQEASQLFRLLIMINTTEPKFTMGLAACLHMMKEYKSAADAYTVLYVIDPHNPVPFYHAADCYIQTGDIFSALVSLRMAIDLAKDKPEFRTLKDRAKMMVESLEKENSAKMTQPNQQG